MNKDLLEFIKLILSWPVVTFALVMFFRKPLTICLTMFHALLGRDIVKVDVGMKGVSIEAAHTAQLESKPASDVLSIAKPEMDNESSAKIEHSQKIGALPIIKQQVKSIEDDLQKMNLSEKQTIDVLTTHLAATQLLLFAERVYRLIFGSQIFLLKSINVSGPSPEEKLREFYDGVKSIDPEFYATYSFDKYIEFLISQGLLSKLEQYSITNLGKEFLKWLTDMGMPENKPF